MRRCCSSSTSTTPAAVPPEWRALFESAPEELLATQPGLARLLERFEQNGGGNGQPPVAQPPPAPAPAPPAAPTAAPDDELIGGVAAAMSLVKAHRTHGHLAAHLDPLGSEPPGDPALEPERLIPKLTPALMARIPAPLLRLYVEGQTLADVYPRLREIYCGSIAYEIEHLSDHEERVWLRQAIESGPLPAAAERRGAGAPARPAHPGRGHGAVSAPRVPRPEAVLDRRARRDGADARRGDRARRRHGRARGGHRDGAPRPSQRARARRRPSVRGDPARVRRRADDRGRRRERRRRQRRREVPPRRGRHTHDAGGRDSCDARVESEPPRGGRSGRRGTDARGADRPLDARGLSRPDRGAADPHPRRRVVRGPGRSRGDPQPRGPRRLLDRRHAALDREQPGRLHDRPERRALDALLERPRERVRHPDHPRERRRSRGGARGCPARPCLQAPLRTRRRGRSRRLPPARPQRAGRACVHAAAARRCDRGASDGARALCAAAGRGRRRHRRGRGRARAGRPRAVEERARGAEGDASARHPSRRRKGASPPRRSTRS